MENNKRVSLNAMVSSERKKRIVDLSIAEKKTISMIVNDLLDIAFIEDRKLDFDINKKIDYLSGLWEKEARVLALRVSRQDEEIKYYISARGQILLEKENLRKENNRLKRENGRLSHISHSSSTLCDFGFDDQDDVDSIWSTQINDDADEDDGNVLSGSEYFADTQWSNENKSRKWFDWLFSKRRDKA